MNWKKLTTEGLNRFIASHSSTQMKNKSHMLVRKTHHSIVFGSITFSRDNFQLNLTCFHMVAKKDFVYCPGCLLEVSGFHHTCTNLILEKNTCTCWIGGRLGQTASLDTVEKRKIPCPYQSSKLWQTNHGLFPNWLCYPSSYSNQ